MIKSLPFEHLLCQSNIAERHHLMTLKATDSHYYSVLHPLNSDDLQRTGSTILDYKDR